MATTMDMPQAVQVRTFSGVDIVAGIWLIAAPFMFNYAANGGSTTNDVTVGIVALILAGIQMSGENYRTSWPSWIMGIMGVWLVIAPFAMGFPSGSAAMWSDVVLGILLAVLGTVTALTVASEDEDGM